MAKKRKNNFRPERKSNQHTLQQEQKPDEFNPDYSDVIKDLKRIGILAGTFFIILIVLAFVLG